MSSNKKLTKTEEEMVNALLELGIDVAMLRKIAGKKKEIVPVDEVVGSYKVKDSGAIEVKRWSDKAGKMYIVQTRVLETGVKTKGFGIPQEEFKAYVSKLNSIVDKLGL